MFTDGGVAVQVLIGATSATGRPVAYWRAMPGTALISTAALQLLYRGEGEPPQNRVTATADDVQREGHDHEEVVVEHDQTPRSACAFTIPCMLRVPAAITAESRAKARATLQLTSCASLRSAPSSE